MGGRKAEKKRKWAFVFPWFLGDRSSGSFIASFFVLPLLSHLLFCLQFAPLFKEGGALLQSTPSVCLFVQHDCYDISSFRLFTHIYHVCFDGKKGIPSPCMHDKRNAAKHEHDRSCAKWNLIIRKSHHPSVVSLDSSALPMLSLNFEKTNNKKKHFSHFQGKVKFFRLFSFLFLFLRLSLYYSCFMENLRGRSLVPAFFPLCPPALLLRPSIPSPFLLLGGPRCEFTRA